MPVIRTLRIVLRTPALLGQAATELSSRLMHQQLIGRIDNVFSLYPADQVIKRLELDLGELDWSEFEHQFTARLLQKLEEALSQLPISNAVALPAVSPSSTDKPPTLQITGAILAQHFTDYLASGYWPWPALWAPMSSVTGQRSTAEQRSAAGQWLRQQIAAEPQVWLSALAAACLQRPLVQRLFRLLSPEDVIAINKLFWPHAPPVSVQQAKAALLTMHALYWLLNHVEPVRGLPAPEQDIMQDLQQPLFSSLWRVLKQQWQKSVESDRQALAAWLTPDLTTVPSRLGSQRSPQDRYEVANRQPGDEPLAVIGAGIVLLWPLLPVLFKRLWPAGMNAVNKQQAVCLLDWLLWQDNQREAEWRTTFLRILCGLAFNTPITVWQQPNEQQQKIANEWLESCVLQLPLPTEISRKPLLDIQSLRLWFLQRPGILLPTSGGWQLTIDSEAQDILLSALPWPLDTWILQPAFIPWLDMELAISWPQFNSFL